MQTFFPLILICHERYKANEKHKKKPRHKTIIRNKPKNFFLIYSCLPYIYKIFTFKE